MRTTRLAARFAVLALLAAAPALAQSEGIAEFQGSVHTDKGKTIPSQGKVYLSKPGVRVEWQTDLSSLADERKAGSREAPNRFRMVMIQRLAEPDRMYVLNEENQTYSVQMIDEKRERTPAPDRKWKVQKLGRDTVGGFACEKALITSEQNGRQTEVCVTTELMPSTAWLRAWNRREEQATPLQALKDAGITGFPIRWIFREKGSSEVSSSIELVRFDKKSLPASLFEVPASYRKVDSTMQTMMTPEQERAAREAQKQMQEALDKMTPEQRKQYEEMMKRYAPTPHN